MSNTVPLKNPFWDLHKGLYEELDDYPLMSNAGTPLILGTLYLVFVLKIGPNIMRKREALKLNTVMIIYNAFQVLLSAYLVYYIGKTVFLVGIVSKQCCVDDPVMRKEILHSYWLYFIAKVTELADTVMFVLRKKDNQVTFLHVYHHVNMMTGTWFLAKYAPSEALMYGGWINSVIHVFMYTYYGLAAFGPQMAKYLTWKKYMTKLQMIQFVSVIIQFTATLIVSDCPSSKGPAIFTLFTVVAFLVLFLNFYIKRYNKKARKTSLNATEAVEICFKVTDKNGVDKRKNLNETCQSGFFFVLEYKF